MKNAPNTLPVKQQDELFTFFTEINILSQLSSTLLENELPSGFKVFHFAVLNNLTVRGEGILPSELARNFQVPRSNMTDILVRLEKSRYIRFEPDPQDGRSKRVFLTKSGRSFREKSIEKARVPLQELSKSFNVSALVEILPTLVELRQVMDGMRS